MIKKDLLDTNYLNTLFGRMSVHRILEYFVQKEYTVAFSSSFGIEDQVLTHIIATLVPQVQIFTLDTGRLHEQTYKTMERTLKRYPNIRIKTYLPHTKSLEEMVNEKGINHFYESVENRAVCCEVRKIEPLKRALEEVDVWVTGRRQEQSLERSSMPIVEFDESFGVYKLNPMAQWNIDLVWEFVKDSNIPYNPLHDCGFASIGCEPCTRAIGEGEDFRKGRWWWEDDSHKECGLHIKRGAR